MQSIKNLILKSLDCTVTIICGFYTVTATQCHNRRPLLDDEITDLEAPFFLLFNGNRITSSSSIPNHSPSEARMSRNGWCAHSICTVGSNEHFLQIDFGAEVVVEAISIDSVDESFYVTEYYVEYGSDVHQLHCVISEESNGTVSPFGLSQY